MAFQDCTWWSCSFSLGGNSPSGIYRDPPGNLGVLLGLGHCCQKLLLKWLKIKDFGGKLCRRQSESHTNYILCPFRVIFYHLKSKCHRAKDVKGHPSRAKKGKTQRRCSTYTCSKCCCHQKKQKKIMGWHYLLPLHSFVQCMEQAYIPQGSIPYHGQNLTTLHACYLDSSLPFPPVRIPLQRRTIHKQPWSSSQLNRNCSGLSAEDGTWDSGMKMTLS